MVEEVEASGEATVGEQLRAAREAQGMSLEDVATRTRIPVRHLESIEASEWSRLPASTYSVGFAKNYATALGLDRDQIGEALKAEMSGYDPRQGSTVEVYELADPARVMPKWLVLLAVVAVIAVIAGLMFMQRRELSGGNEPAATAPADTSAAPATTTAPAPAAPAVRGPVVLTANDPVWLQVSEKGGPSLFMGELKSGQSYEVPATAKAPVLKTGKPEALRISVGTADAPAVGPAGQTVRDVSLLAADLMRGGTATPAPPTPAPTR
ncbi:MULTISPECIES: helix-turn-helix domain-containing protein [Sphingomonas]|uniref:helix-turn-helix domain-containing protein n=1 Tax=Sphingomonas TaxID=13687 RepID=UPI000DEFD8DF|nr:MULTISPECIES: helix-turn-helix domain-containing protein [Sphingomonas]